MNPPPDRAGPFPPGFLWGTATSAYQIEGGVDLDGRGASIWDTFCSVPGNVANGDTGSVACDHRRRWRDDVELMAQLGYGAYRFSVSWPRVQPTGTDEVSESGLDFYRRLVDGLLEHAITPVVTLYHWDLPQALEDAGGWPSRDTAYRFADYAATVVRALSDRVQLWSTLNEPWCTAMLGYAAGVHAPGRQDPAAAVAAGHHLLLAHGLGVEAVRSAVGGDGQVGITLNLIPVVAAGDADADVDAARRVDAVNNRMWTGPLFDGRYPDDLLEDLVPVCDPTYIRPGDLEVIARPIDFLGVNYYRRYHVRHQPGASSATPWNTWPGSHDVRLVSPDRPRTAMRWAVEPDGLTELLVQLHREHPALPLYVHENGAAFDDRPEPGPDGVIDDTPRVEFLRDHVEACRAAIAAGADLRGFFVWSLLDNFEWAQGYRRRFGLVAVRPGSLDRVPKRSALWYADIARAGGSIEAAAGGDERTAP